MTARIFMVALLVGFLAMPCFAAEEQLSIRLVEATSDEKADAEGLKDIVAILKKNLAYSNYRLLASCTIALPFADEIETRVLGDYTVKLSGPRDNLSVSIFRGNKRALKTTISLQVDKPFMLGGLPGQTGKLILVFLVN